MSSTPAGPATPTGTTASPPAGRITAEPPRVALIGAGGHGVSHRRTLQSLVAAGAVRLVALCDRQPIVDEPGAPVADTACYDDHRVMLASERPDIVVICTPPHTHLPIAVDAARSGAHLLLEKPPVAGMDEYHQLREVLAETGRVCQVGFQALASTALTRFQKAIADGDLGTVATITACGAWWRPDSYYRRTAWAGRRVVDGRPVLDGVLVNPLAHALMQTLAIAGVDRAPSTRCRLTVELERYRSRPIDVDDIAVLRITLDNGQQLLVAAGLASTEFIAGDITVTGTAGSGQLQYPTDRLQLPGMDRARTVPGRVDLLVNLIDHLRDDQVALVAPLERTALFTRLAEFIVQATPPATIDRRHLVMHPGANGLAVAGLAQTLREAADTVALPSELAVPWAQAPVRAVLVINNDRTNGTVHEGADRV